MVRPQAYTDEELLRMLLEVKTKHHGKITPNLLHKETNISRTVWINRMSDQINAINEPIIGEEDQFSGFTPSELPSLSKVIIDNLENRKKLLDIVNKYDLIFQRNWEKSVHYDQLVKDYDNLSIKIKELELQLEQAKNNENYYKELYKSVVVKSKYSTIRREENLNNVLNLSDNSRTSIRNKQAIEKAQNLLDDLLE